MNPDLSQARNIAETAHVAAIIGLVCLAVAIVTQAGFAIGGHLFNEGASAGERLHSILLAIVEPEYFGLLAFSLFVMALGHVLTTAAQLKAENDSFV